MESTAKEKIILKSTPEEHAQDLEYIRNFRLIDDDFMKKVFEDKACTELMLRIIMEKPELEVTELQTEYEVHNLWGRSIRIDVHAKEGKDKEYAIEIQRADKGAGQTRARYNSSLIDANALNRGVQPEKLPETYVIFITENDVLNKGLPIYHIDRMITEDGSLFNDKAHIIYVNGENTEDTPLGRLMADFRCKDAKDICYPLLAERVGYFKENDEGVSSMCKAMEEMRDRVAAAAAAEASKKADYERRIITALTLLGMNKLSIEDIAKASELTVDEVIALNNNPAA